MRWVSKPLRTGPISRLQSTGGPTMEASIDYHLRKVVRGTVAALLGSILGLFLVFLSRVLMARYLSVREYGIFSLCYVIVTLLTVLSLVGLDAGTSRQIAFSRRENGAGKIGGIIRSSLLIATTSSVVAGFLLFVLSDYISVAFFQTKELAVPLKIVSIGLPFLTLLLLFVSIYRGFDRADMKVYFSDLAKNGLFVLFLGLCIVFQLSLDFILMGFVLAVAISCAGIITFTLRKPPRKELFARYQPLGGLTRELLVFSIPLLVLALFSLVVNWTDTIVLGYLRTTEDVGIYNAALPIALLIPILLNGMSYIYMPVLSDLYSQKKLNEIRRMYAVTTKWIFALTYPIFLVVVLFPRPVLSLLFGRAYLAGSTALQILVIGFFVHTFLGLNGATLLSLGETKYLMWASAISSIVNILLNLILILWFGILGAAVATALSLFVLNIFLSSRCYQRYRIHPFTKKYLRPILVSIPAVLVTYTIVYLLVGMESIWLLPTSFMVFLLLYFGSVLLTRSFDQEDLTIILGIEGKLGLDLKNLKRILRKFL